MKYAYIALLIAAFTVIQCLVGGTRLLFMLPSCGLLAAAGLLSVFSMRRIKAVPNPACLLTAAIFTAYLLGRALFSPMLQLARPDIFSILACAMVYLLVTFYVTSAEDRMILLWGLFALASVQVIVGLVQFGRGEEFMLFLERYPSGRRASGMFVNPNHFAGFLEIMAMVGLSLLWWSRLSLLQKVLVTYVALSCFTGVALSGSRGGYLSCLVGLAAFATLSLWTVKKTDPDRFPVATILVGVAIGIFFFGVTLMQKSDVLNYRIEQIGAEDMRTYNWEAAIDQFESKPIFGTGAGTHLFYGRLYRRPEIQVDPQHAHNDYLELLGDYGLAGAAAALAFAVMHIISGVKNSVLIAQERLKHFYIARSNGFALQLGALSGLAAIAAHSFVDFNLHIPANAMVVAVLFGILANPGVEHIEEPAAPHPLRHLRFALPLLALLVLVAGAGRVRGEYYAERARVALRNRQLRLTIEMGEKGLRHDRENSDLYFYIGEGHRALAFARRVIPGATGEELKLADAAFHAGVAIFPDDEHLLIRSAQTLDGLKRYDEAEQLYRHAIEIDPNLGILHSYYSEHLRAQGRATEAAVERDLGSRLGDRDMSLFRIPEITDP